MRSCISGAGAWSEQLHAQLHQWSMGEQLREQLCGQLRAVSSCVSLQGADTSREQPHE